MMARAPAFQFYPRQFAGDDQVMGMDLEAIGAHILLMCAAASSPERCRIDADEYAMRMRLRNPSDDTWQRIKKQLLAGAWKLTEDGKWWIQSGLQRTFQKQKEFSDQQRAKANRKWEVNGAKSLPDSCRNDAAEMSEAMPDVCSSSASSSSNQNITSEPCGPDSKAARSKKTSASPTETGLRLAQILQRSILKNNANARVTASQIQQWALEADRMVRLDRRTPQQIEDLIHFSQSDPFWFANILSMSKLRKQFDQLTNQRLRKQQWVAGPEAEESEDESHAGPKWIGLTDDLEPEGGAK